MATVWKWTFDRLVKTIVATLLNKYDFFMTIEGGTGSGKSTLALNLILKVKREFKKLKDLDYDTVKYYYELIKLETKGISEEEFVQTLIQYNKDRAYEFKLNRNLVYKRDEMLSFLSKYNGMGISDEGANTMLNRDFWNEDQKNLVKVINMYRDHNNLCITCIASFNVLDNQIKNLVKMRLSILRRGVAMIQTPNKTFYGRDKWDTSNNEKIERDWLMKKSKKPQYAKLTTFRGLVRFPKLSPKIEVRYQKIKDKKRNIVLNEEMGIKIKKDETAEDKLYERLIKGGIKNMQLIEGVAIAEGLSNDQLKGRLRRRLEKEGHNTALTSYFSGKNKVEVKDEAFKETVSDLAEKL